MLLFHITVQYFWKIKIYSNGFLPFVNFKDKNSYLYIEKIKAKNPKFYLTYSFENQNPNLVYLEIV